MAEDNTSDFDEEKEGAEAEAAAEEEAEKKEEGKEEGKEEEEDEGKEDEEDFDENEEPPTRKSAKDHIIERRGKKIEKLEREKEEEEDEDEENPFSEEDQKAIKKEVSKETEPLKEVLKAQSDKNELDALIANPEKYPGAKSMEKRITKYMKHKSYRDVPVENIYHMLANEKSNLQAKKTEAKEKDKENESIGHTKREKSGGEPDYQNMPEEEFDKVDRELTESQ